MPENPVSQSHNDASLPELYEYMVQQGRIHDDRGQRDIVEALETLRQQLMQPSPQNGALARLFKKSSTDHRGLYIWGNVGRGKSMVMDLFFNHVPISGKRRVHFHAFMQEVHGRIHALRQENQRSGAGTDPVIMLARQLAGETSLLCFDELQATDVADATLLYRLFHGLFQEGVTIVSTSNHPPATLYTGGIQAERFQKFITLLEERMHIMPLISASDYRLLQPRDLQRVYFTPLGKPADQFVEDVLSQLCPQFTPRQDSLIIQGRRLEFTGYGQHIASFTFRSLCESPLGAADYLAVAQRFNTLILLDIPQLSPEKRNEAKRFVTLVDALYERKVKLICTAAVPPEHVYHAGDGAFEFQRTVSRLMEMQSAGYLQA